jgi:Helix-turn-helix of DDE superfamily endonuclease
MLSYEAVKKNRQQFLSLTGMEVEVFDTLHEAYQKQWNKYIKEYTVAGEKRTRAHRKRSDGVLEQTEDQLLFVLHYLKSNSIQEHHAATYGMRQSQCNMWLHLLLRLLHQPLKTLKQLPERDATKLSRTLKGLREVFIDGTERDIDRPVDNEEQRKHYSGKKNAIRSKTM